MKNKGGEVYGSIYERKRKDRDTISYTAEIQFQGQKVRRSSKDKKSLEIWMSSICTNLNEIVSEYRQEEAIMVKLLKDKLYNNMLKSVMDVLSKAKEHDFRSKKCAVAMGIVPVDHFQTYLIHDDVIGLTKIGKSHDIHTRMGVMGKECISLLGYCDRDIETLLHEQYKKQRIKGEWFDLTNEDIGHIISAHGFIDTRGYFFERGTVLV